MIEYFTDNNFICEVFMNAAYVYLQLYRLFDNVTPLHVDCGELCSKACCQGDDCGMFLFPGEVSVFKLLNPEWVKIEKSDFTYTHGSKTYHTPLAMCNGDCDRYQRPMACRIFPLTPYLTADKQLKVIIDPRAKSICPLAKGFMLSDFDGRFIHNIEKSFTLLMKNRHFADFMTEYSAYIDDFRRFFNRNGDGLDE